MYDQSSFPSLYSLEVASVGAMAELHIGNRGDPDGTRESGSTSTDAILFVDF